MQVEHLTLGGNSVIRYTQDILPLTIEILKPFQIKEGVKVIPFPDSKFIVKVSAVSEGVMFDLNKDGKMAFSNVCCFEKDHSGTMLENVKLLHDLLPIFAGLNFQTPKTDRWLYSIPIDFAHLSDEEMRLAGEIEFYIYYSLLLSRIS